MKLKTWKFHLQDQFANFEQFKEWNEYRHLDFQLGYKTEAEAWVANPLLQASSGTYLSWKLVKVHKPSKNLKVNTVNVVKVVNDVLNAIHSFQECAEGNKAAEKLFTRLVREHNKLMVVRYSNNDIEDMIDDGSYTDGFGYTLYICHSS